MTIKKSYLSQRYQFINFFRFFSILILSPENMLEIQKIIHIQIRLDELYLMIYKTKNFLFMLHFCIWCTLADYANKMLYHIDYRLQVACLLEYGDCVALDSFRSGERYCDWLLISINDRTCHHEMLFETRE